MSPLPCPSPCGYVASLHLHPPRPGEPLRSVDHIFAVAAKGIQGDDRYFGRISKDTGRPGRRQVSLIEREQLAEHATALGLSVIPPGAARSNIETTGIKLIVLVGREVQVGEALLFLYAPRDPCAKMDAICLGLRQRMMHGHQGVLAQVRRSGRIRIGDPIRLVEQPPAGSTPA